MSKLASRRDISRFFRKRKNRRLFHATSTNSFVAEIEVIIKAVCIVDSCVKLMRGPSLQQWIDIFSENAKSLYHNLPISVCLSKI